MTGECIRRARSRSATTLAITFLLAACAEPAPEADVATTDGTSAAPAQAAAPATSGLTVRLDSESGDPAEFVVAQSGAALSVQTGPAGIAYRPGDAAASGDFGVQASFELRDAPVGYREAYGLIVGGLDLTGPDLEYTYLLIRPTGDYLIKRRLGEVTETLVDWTSHEAIVAMENAGDTPVNTLSVVVSGQNTHFNLNGVTVESLPTSRVRPHGVAGLRVNHRLNVQVTDWALGTGVES